MFIDDLNNKKILILGITNVSISIYNYLKDKTEIFIYDFSEKVRTQFKDEYFVLNNIDNISFNDFDYFIAPKDILLISDEYNIFLERLYSIKERVFIDIEFLYKLFPENTYIGIIGSGYNYLINSTIYHVLHNLDMPVFNCASFEERNNFNQVNKSFENAIITISLRQAKMTYLKDMDFNILAVLNDIDLDYVQKEAFLNQKSVLILNIDNDEIFDMYEEITHDENILCKIIPISINKILDNGFSFVNGTIYNYFNGKNESYDISINFYTDFMITTILCSFVVLNELGIDVDTIKDCLNSYRGIPNFLEVVDQIENIKFINNIEATTEKLIIAPYKVYNNIYSIVIVNSKQSKTTILKEVLNNSSKIFLVDLHNLVDIDNKKVLKFDNLKSAFEKAIEEAELEEKENEINILLTPMIGDDMNTIYYNSFGDDFKELIEEYKKED